MEKYAVVTGSTKGIGKAVGIRLIQAGYHVIFNYSSDEESCEALKAELSQENAAFSVIRQKLETEQDVRAFVSACLDISDSFDVIVCNAGCTDRAAWKDMSWEAWEKVMNVNINAPAFMLRLFDEHISEGGNVVLTGSDMGIFTHAMSVPYSVSKGAVHALAKSLVKVYEDRGIRVNAIAPGFVDTPWQSGKPEEIRTNIENKIALHRFAEPEEIADMVMSIIENGYINGSVVQVDGGYCFR